jgi:NAD(P)-dependent dehydrogenase (short-subunit alcohol dehydrogenase family)
MPPDMRGKNVLVTGGSSGIGLEVARLLLERGAHVLIVARGEGRLAEATRALRSEHPHDRVYSLPCDVTSTADLDRALDLLEARCGNLTTLVHAAGVLGAIGPLVDTDPTAWFEVVRINLLGTMVAARQCAQRLLRHVSPADPLRDPPPATGLAQGAPAATGASTELEPPPAPPRGRLVLFSGGGAATPFPHYTAYGCAKAGVVRLAETLAIELAPHQIAVNALSPGMVATPIHQATLEAGSRAGNDYLQRTQQLLASGGFDIRRAAEAAVFLASDEATGITGRLLAAPWDGWERWPEHKDELAGDLFTLRRIVPRDRGQDWQ